MHNYHDQEFFEKYSVRTDLALEAHQVVTEHQGPPLPGVKVSTVEKDKAVISRVIVENEVGARMIGKAPGRYSTIESPALREHNRDARRTSPLLSGRAGLVYPGHPVRTRRAHLSGGAGQLERHS